MDRIRACLTLLLPVTKAHPKRVVILKHIIGWIAVAYTSSVGWLVISICHAAASVRIRHSNRCLTRPLSQAARIRYLPLRGHHEIQAPEPFRPCAPAPRPYSRLLRFKELDNGSGTTHRVNARLTPALLCKLINGRDQPTQGIIRWRDQRKALLKYIGGTSDVAEYERRSRMLKPLLLRIDARIR